MNIYSPYLLGQHNLRSAFSAGLDTKGPAYIGTEKPAAEVVSTCVGTSGWQPSILLLGMDREPQEAGL